MSTHIVTNYTSRSPRFLAKLRTLHALCWRHGVALSKFHLPSVLNCWADRLSRCRHTPDWTLSPTAVQIIQRLFAAPLSVLDGNILPGRLLTKGVLAVVTPRPSLQGVWTRLLLRSGGLLVAPRWPRQL